MFGIGTLQLVTLVLVVAGGGLGLLRRSRAKRSMTSEEAAAAEVDEKRQDAISGRSYLRGNSVLLAILGVVMIASGLVWAGIAALALAVGLTVVMERYFRKRLGDE